MPAEIVAKLNKAINESLKAPGMEPVCRAPRQPGQSAL
jgi:hypothetical protein